MGEVTIAFKRPDGEDVEMPLAQAIVVAGLVEMFEATWHMADCGCCACVHPAGDTTKGWLVGADGGSDWHEGH